jgi:HEPN domain-containing protein
MVLCARDDKTQAKPAPSEVEGRYAAPGCRLGLRPAASRFFVAPAAGNGYDDRMADTSDQWADQARYDLGTAQAMLAAQRYLYVLFCCQQATEKMLKAVIARRTREHPPRVHHLVRLAEVARVEVDESQADLLRELSTYYIQSRYPEEIPDLASKVRPDEAKRILGQTEGLLQWLSTMR